MFCIARVLQVAGTAHGFLGCSLISCYVTQKRATENPSDDEDPAYTAIPRADKQRLFVFESGLS